MVSKPLTVNHPMSITGSTLSNTRVTDRSQPVLQTVLVVTFDRQNGPKCFFDTLKTLWTEAVKMIDIPEAERNEDQKDKLKELERGIETILNIMSQLESSKYLHD